MRKANAILTAVIMVLLLLHGVLGSLSLIGAGETTLRVLSWITLGLVGVHMILGIILTAQSVKVWHKTGAPYFKQNHLFWARRISGLAIMILIAFHVTAFGGMNQGAFRLSYFGTFKLITEILLAVAILFHIITNVKPMLISFGIKKLKPKASDILFVVSILFVFFVAAYIIYFIRWNAV